MDPAATANSGDVTSQTRPESTRRRFLGLGAILATAGVAKVIAADTAHATVGAMQFGSSNNAGVSQTSLSSTSAKTLYVDNLGTGIAIEAFSASATASTIQAFHSGSGGDPIAAAVYGYTNAGIGVHALAYGPGVGLRARSNGQQAGVAIESVSESTLNPDTNATFTHEGLGHGIYASLNNAVSNSYAIVASTKGSASALLANGLTQARGIKIRSQIAHLWLVPAATASHPASGNAGDLFVDKSKRLWFCKGGASWVLIA